MEKQRTRANEFVIYFVLWLIALAIYILDETGHRSHDGVALFTPDLLRRTVIIFLPYFVLFTINNHLLIPLLLLRNKVKLYFISAVAAILVSWAWQYYNFEFLHFSPIRQLPLHPAPGPRPLIPLPLILDLTFSVLVVGINVAIALIFQRFDDRLEKEKLLKANAQGELSYLKTQINPHFYMNMLNNIHGMIELNPDKAQEMVLEMSNLMRYMLYDSALDSIPLSKEIDFLKNYISLMAMRFPPSRVSVNYHFPSDSEAARISLPPLLFLVFIENAFKHGISYRKHSTVEIKMDIDKEYIYFSCSNSVNTENIDSAASQGGIGLKNIRQRLFLIFGATAEPIITQSNDTYTVTLKLPIVK